VALKDQILLLDRKLRKAELGDLPNCDTAIFETIDNKRLRAFGRYMADKIVHRFWGERFPATIRGIAFALGGHETPLAEVAQKVMASEWFEKTIGEDVTATGLLGWLVAHRDEVPPWLLDMAGYEYLLSCGLPRLAQDLQRDLELEKRLLPDLNLISRWDKEIADDHFALNKTLAFICFDYPVTELQEVLSCGGRIEAEVLVEPQAVLLALDHDGLLELDPSYPAADLLQLCASPQSSQTLCQTFSDQDEILSLVGEFVQLALLKQGIR
jgi:hypothetical protein